ncbi:MAG: BlaI/MecI/CopY family transcriptional regulator [Oscillospiraceae bacterium]|nr:BlaI/MecI/CopY family transcriptional regulator [Oscillospiraceae bacterium]MCL2278450.1 BlaI/MecI/CopY family transcriptional regulator [Oscillospiraceae bacterium]
MELTKNELQFISVLWRSETPLTAPQILESPMERTWADRSLHVILNNLLSKGAIAEHGFVKEGRTISRTFVPVLTHKEYYTSLLAECESKELLALVSAVIRERTDIGEETAGALESIVRRWSGK